MEPEARPNVVEEPAVVGWYRAYCAFMILVFALIVPLAVWAQVSSSPFSGYPTPTGSFGHPVMDQMLQQMENERKAAAILPIIVSLCVAALALFAMFMKPTPSAWSYHILIMCLGLGGCTLPFAVIMLINWFQPATQAYFGRGPSATGSA